MSTELSNRLKDQQTKYVDLETSLNSKQTEITRLQSQLSAKPLSQGESGKPNTNTIASTDYNVT